MSLKYTAWCRPVQPSPLRQYLHPHDESDHRCSGRTHRRPRGGVGALAVASGSAAVTYAIMNLAAAGDQIVAASTLYGGTLNLLHNTLPHYGITTAFADPDDLDTFVAATTAKTKAWYVESIGNPNGNLVDLARMAEMAHAQGSPDRRQYVWHTLPDPADGIWRRHRGSFDDQIHRGHGTSLGGVVVDAGRFDFNTPKFPLLSQPDPGYHGLA